MSVIKSLLQTLYKKPKVKLKKWRNYVSNTKQEIHPPRKVVPI